MRNEIDKLSRLVNDALRRRGLTLAVAESCTGGGIAAVITSVPGSSDIFNGGVVAYSNEAKNNLLSVSVEDLCRYGAVSEAVVRQMALGVATIMHASCAIATSGIAGPGGGTAEKPVGTVWTAFLINGVVKTCKLNLEDRGRKENTESAILETIKIFHSLLCDN